jgi:sugar lactone lactonase YvrE
MRAFSDSSRGSRGRLLRLPSFLLLPLLLLSCGGGGDSGSVAPAGTVTSSTPGIALLAGALGGPGNLDSTGTAARFSGPLGVAIDSSGNIYVADTSNDVIRKITPSGVVSTLAGTPGKAGATDGTGSAARFNGPSGIAVDTAGIVYVTDMQNGTVRKITPAGDVSTLAGLAGSYGSTDDNGSNARFIAPFGIAVDMAGNVFVTDSAANTVREITPAGDVTTLAGNATVSGDYLDGTGSAARFSAPAGIAVDSSGNLYVADAGNQVIRMVTIAGVVSTVAGVPTKSGSDDGDTAHAHFNTPIGMAVDSGGALYVTELANETVRKIASGMVSTVAGLAGTTGTADGNGSTARFNAPAGIAVDATGQLFVADRNNNSIRAISTTADVTTFTGLPAQQAGTDGNGGAARFSTPDGIAVFPDGRLAVADTGNDTIRTVTMAGDVTTLAGTAGAVGTTDGSGSLARFQNPVGLAADAAGNLYVADTLNHTIRTVAPDGTVATLAGSPGTSGNADGAGLTTARFSLPGGVTVGPQGNLYVADTGNSLIRQITPGGIVSTLAGNTAGSGFADGTGSAAYFSVPVGLVVDLAGNIYVADTGNNAIRRITPGGVVTTLAGNSLAGAADGNGRSATFNKPQGIAIDGDGNLYVADTGNSLLRKVTPAGDVTTLAGTAGVEGVAPGGLPGTLNHPLGIAVGADGKLYVSSENSLLAVALAAPVSRFGVAVTASATSLILGQSATLSWASADAASCTASGDWSGSKALTGNESVTPSAAGTTTYTLTCTQSVSGATKSASVTITTVLPAPTVSLSASASHIKPGDPVTLTWSSTTATSCTSTGAGWSGSQNPAGSVTLNPPDGLQAYTLTCTGGGGTASASTSVAVALPPAVTFNASALSIPLGGSTTLTWSSTDTTSCTAAGAWSGNKSTSGSQVVTPSVAGSQTYTLSCGGLNGYDSKSVVVSVQAPAAASSGGGAFDTSLLLGFGLLGLVRRRGLRRC